MGGKKSMYRHTPSTVLFIYRFIYCSFRTVNFKKILHTVLSILVKIKHWLKKFKTYSILGHIIYRVIQNKRAKIKQDIGDAQLNNLR